ncbi:hypothetical protein M0R45_002170 [Rubus argutus]|uniref:Uncharacterized protein n=1 Tax=Rubus argutus TaxID=59490 RepID=A0AAW1VK22_RUBAR
MKNLRYFSSSEDVCYSGNIDFLSNKLRWLDWSKCPIQSFPSNFHPKELVALNIPDSSHITRLWEGRKVFPNLTYMNLSGCASLMELPEIIGKMDSLIELDLSGSGIKELHPSIGYLIGLEELYLQNCENLSTLPCSIYGLQNLEWLNLSTFSKLVTFPANTRSLHGDNGDDSLSLPKLKVLEGKESQGIEWINLWNCQGLCDNLGYNMDKLERILLNNQENSPFGVVFPGSITAEVAKWFGCWENVIGKEIVPCNCGQSFVMRLWPPSAPQRGPCYNTCDCECSITISKNLKWENIGLAICVVFEEGKQYYFEYEISINEVCITPFGDDPWTSPSSSSTSDEKGWSRTLTNYNEESCSYRLESEFKFEFWCPQSKEDVYFSSRTDSTSDHVWLRYITLPIESKAEVDDQKGCSSPYYMCELDCPPNSKRNIESCGVHLVCQQSKDDEYSSDKVFVEPTQQNRHRTGLLESENPQQNKHRGPDSM